jgi:hypothetical protein
MALVKAICSVGIGPGQQRALAPHRLGVGPVENAAVVGIVPFQLP